MSRAQQRDTGPRARRATVVLLLSLLVPWLEGPPLAANAQEVQAGKPQLVRADDARQGLYPDDGRPVAAEILVVLGSGKVNEDGNAGEVVEVDSSLSHVRTLKHEPFSNFKTLKLLWRKQVQLPREQSVEVALPNKRTLVLRLVSLLHDGRAKLAVSISRPNRKEYLPLLEVIASTGEPFFVAGQHFDGGTLILGIRAGDALKLSH